MPVGELIAAAVGLILIIVVAYVLVGSTIGTAETMASAQRDMTHLQVVQLHTDIAMTVNSHFNNSPETVNFIITNTGRERSRLRYVDVFIIKTPINRDTLGFDLPAMIITQWEEYRGSIHPVYLSPRSLMGRHFHLDSPLNFAHPHREYGTGSKLSRVTGCIISAHFTVNSLGHL